MRYIKIFELYNKEAKADLLAKQLNISDEIYTNLKKIIILPIFHIFLKTKQ